MHNHTASVKICDVLVVFIIIQIALHNDTFGQLSNALSGPNFSLASFQWFQRAIFFVLEFLPLPPFFSFVVSYYRHHHYQDR